MPPLLLYTLARLGLFAAVYGLIWLMIGRDVPFDSISGLWTALIAMVVSSLIALIALRRLRERLSTDIATRASRMQRSYQPSAAALDRDQETGQRTHSVQQLSEPRVPEDSDQA